jgi:flagellar motor switch protein FliN
MSPESANPAGGGDISEDELRKILGDDYDSVVGKGEEAGATDQAAADAAPAPISTPPPTSAPAPPPVAGPAPTAGGTPGDGVTPNMTEAEAEAWAAEMEVQMAQDAVAPSAVPAAAATPFSSSSATATLPRPAAAMPASAPTFAVPPSVVQPVQFAQIEDGGSRAHGSIDVLLDVRLPISVELGRTEMEVKEILEFGPGTVIELTKLAGEPVDIYINGRLVAQGEVVVVDEHFGVRVTSLLTPTERVRSLA